MNALTYLLQLLQSSTTLQNILKPSVTDTKIYPLTGKPNCNCISYKWYEITNDKIKAQCKFEVRCFSDDIIVAYQMLDEIKKLILTFGDSELNNDILSVELNGGITPMEDIDTSTYYVGGFFDVIVKL